LIKFLIFKSCREYQAPRSGKSGLKTIPVQTSLSFGCEVKANHYENQNDLKQPTKSDSRTESSRISQLKGGCVVAECPDKAEIFPSTDGSYVWPKHVRRQVNSEFSKAQACHLSGASIRGSELKDANNVENHSEQSISKMNGDQNLSLACNSKNISSVGSLISGDFDASIDSQENYARRQVPHRLVRTENRNTF
jgi:hypothetical protein